MKKIEGVGIEIRTSTIFEADPFVTLVRQTSAVPPKGIIGAVHARPVAPDQARAAR